MAMKNCKLYIIHKGQKHYRYSFHVGGATIVKWANVRLLGDTFTASEAHDILATEDNTVFELPIMVDWLD
jgi:hypothetical protein